MLGLMGSVGDRVSPSDREGSMSYIKGNRQGSNDEDDVGMGSDGNPNSGAEGESDGDVEEVRSALGIMRMDRGKSFYRGETHWAVILSEVRFVGPPPSLVRMNLAKFGHQGNYWGDSYLDLMELAWRINFVGKRVSSAEGGVLLS